MSEDGADPVLDLGRIAELMLELLDEFKNHYGDQRVSEEQEIRGFLISWLTVFVPEALSEEFRNRLETFWRERRIDDQWRFSGWFRLAALDPAMSAVALITIDHLTANIDHHNSNLRPPVLLALALMAPRLSFGNPDLRQRVENSLGLSYMCADMAAALYLAAEGDAKAKTEWAAGQVLRGGHNPPERELLEAVAEHEFVPNPFASEFSNIERYAWFRLAAVASGQSRISLRQMPLGRGITWTELSRRLAAHPLAGPYISI